MPDKISFDIVSPEQLVLSAEAEMVTIPGTEGDMGVMAGHMPLITTLRAGMVAVSGGPEPNQRFFVSGGFAEVNSKKLTLLAEEAIPAAEFDRAALDARIALATEEMAAAKTEAEKAARAFHLHNLEQLRSAH